MGYDPIINAMNEFPREMRAEAGYIVDIIRAMGRHYHTFTISIYNEESAIFLLFNKNGDISPNFGIKPFYEFFPKLNENESGAVKELKECEPNGVLVSVNAVKDKGVCVILYEYGNAAKMTDEVMFIDLNTGCDKLSKDENKKRIITRALLALGLTTQYRKEAIEVIKAIT